MTVLAQWNENWYLAGRSGAWADSTQFSMKVGLCMPGSTGFKRVNNYLSRTFDSMGAITFYHEIRYWGMPVYPEHWHPESAEPLLHCRLMGNEIHRLTDVAGRVEAAAVAHRSEEDRLRWLELLEQTEANARELRTRLVDDGWDDRGGDGLLKYVHVNDLEKIEGAPPEGPF